jgi:GNAT superfamily N-acetyltransferase
MPDILQIIPNTALPSGLTVLRDEASARGFRFLERLASEWESGANRFAQSGECLLGAYRDRRLIGTGGLNRDPYAASEDIARLRHVYVLAACRRQGAASAITLDLIARAQGWFRQIRLRTDSTAADAFYLRLGFTPIVDPQATHAMVIAQAAMR